MNEKFEDFGIIVLILLVLFLLFCCAKAHSQTIPASAQQQVQNAANTAHQSLNNGAQAIQNAYAAANMPMNSAGYAALQSLGIGHSTINANIAPILTQASFVMPSPTIPTFTPPVITPIVLPMNTILPTDTILQYTLPNGYTSTIPVITQ